MNSIRCIFLLISASLLFATCQNDKNSDPVPAVIDFRTQYVGDYLVYCEYVTTVFGQPTQPMYISTTVQISLSDSSTSQLIYKAGSDSLVCDSLSSTSFQMWDYVSFHAINGSMEFFDVDSIKYNYGGAISPAASFSLKCRGKKVP